MAKRRIRTLLRSGWTEVKVPRKNLYKYDPARPETIFGDRVYMDEIIQWCQERYDPANYTYAPPPAGQRGLKYEDCCKRFIFKNEKDATLFLLRWGT